MAAFPRAAAFAASVLLVMSAAVPVAGVAPAIIRTPAEPTYTVDLRSNTDGTSWVGRMEVEFTNLGDAPAGSAWLRLWGNGVGGCPQQAVLLSDVGLGAPGDLLRRCTAQEIVLPSDVAVGARGSFEVGLSIEVPNRNDRFGHHAGMSMMGNALPVLAVTDDRGLHLDPYADLGESFYSIAGRYRVTMNVPRRLEIAATGAVSEVRRDGTREVRTYAARDVRDFAWASSLDFMSITGHAGETRIRVWFRPELIPDHVARTVLANSVDSMQTFSSAFGRYPYHEVDVVVSAFTTFGGMEYPQIVFSNPERITVAHELAHQWWFGIVGDDQYTEPWLDESFATWASYLPYNPWRACVSFDWPSAGARLTNDMGYWHDHPTEYGTIYFGGGCMLANLAHRFGLQRFESILARFAEQHWLGVARTDEFQRVIGRAAERRLTGFDAEAFWSRWRVG